MNIRAAKFYIIFLLATTSLWAGSPASAQELSPVGTWKTIDDKSGKVKSIIQITETNGELQGKVEKVFSPPAESERPICDKCEGELKGKPVIGMTIMTGLKKDGD